MTTPNRVPLRHAAFKAAACATTLAALLALATTARAQVTDNFDSGGFDPAAGWATFNNSPTYPTTFSFPADTSSIGGYAFRMQGGIPLNHANNGIGTARAAAVCTNQVYSDFYVAADLVNWETNYYTETNYTFLGLAARVTTNLAGFVSATNFSGLAMFYWINVQTQNTNSTDPVSLSNADGPGTGIMALGYILNGNMDFAFPLNGIVPSAIAEWTLEPGHSYRFVFQGVGKDLTGKVYDLQDLTTPRGTISGDTSIAQVIYGGVPAAGPAPTNGWSGLMALRFNQNDNDNGITDATFDNFYAAATAPTPPSPTAVAHGLAGVPQVVNRRPASWSNFYSPAGGITFTGSTLSASTTLNTSATRLILNGIDVSSSLTPPVTTSVGGVSYYYYTFGLAGSSYSLASNVVYDASIILQDSLNRRTTNIWTFDTFTDAYLASESCKNIECEDYDYAFTPDGAPEVSGYFQPFPVSASGYSTNDSTWYKPPGASVPLSFGYGINIANNQTPLPEAQVGYVGLKGLQATNFSDPGDYYQCTRQNSMPGVVPNLLDLAGSGDIDLATIFPACDYRTGGGDANTAIGSPPPNFWGAAHGDAVGTMLGFAYGVSVVDINLTGGIIYYERKFDTKRQKYAALNAVGQAQFNGSDGNHPLPPATGSGTLPWWDVEEYVVCMTDGSDWFNYTKDWGTVTNSYNVYLRNACGASQKLNFYFGATTNRASLLGTFSCTNAAVANFRYTPLIDTNGSLAVVKLGNPAETSLTLRLEVEPDQPQWASIARGLALNYLAFVPTGRAQLVTNVVYSTTNRIVSVVKNGSTNFTVNALGTVGAQYYLVSSGNIKTAMGSWTPVLGSTNTVTNPNGTWSCLVSNSSPAYYRVRAVNPAP